MSVIVTCINKIIHLFIISSIVSLLGCQQPDPLYFNEKNHAIEGCNGNSVNGFRIYSYDKIQESYRYKRIESSTSKRVFTTNLTSKDYIIVNGFSMHKSDKQSFSNVNDTLVSLRLISDIEYRISSYAGGSGMSRDSFELKFRVDTMSNVIWASRTKCP